MKISDCHLFSISTSFWIASKESHFLPPPTSSQALEESFYQLSCFKHSSYYSLNRSILVTYFSHRQNFSHSSDPEPSFLTIDLFTNLNSFLSHTTEHIVFEGLLDEIRRISPYGVRVEDETAETCSCSFLSQLSPSHQEPKATENFHTNDFWMRICVTNTMNKF